MEIDETRSMKFILLICLVGSLLIYSCESNSGSRYMSPVWDSIECVYKIPARKLVYESPHRNSSIFATADMLPDGILMCMVDTMTNVSTLLFQFEKISENEEAAREQIGLIAAQDDAFSLVQIDNLYRCSILDSDAWEFNVSVKLKHNNNVYDIIYSGYLIDHIGIVATGDKHFINSQGLQPYLRGLRHE